MKYRIKRRNSTDYIGSLSVNSEGVYGAFYKQKAKVWKTKKGVEEALAHVMKNDHDDWVIEEEEE